MVDFKSITEIDYKFDQHPTQQDAATFLDLNYAYHLPDLDALFTDDTKQNLKPDAIKIIRRQITEVIKKNAADTQDPSVISPCVDKFTVSIQVGTAPPMRIRSSSDIKKALTTAVHQRLPTVTLKINLSQLYFDNSWLLTYLN